MGIILLVSLVATFFCTGCPSVSKVKKREIPVKGTVKRIRFYVNLGVKGETGVWGVWVLYTGGRFFVVMMSIIHK